MRRSSRGILVRWALITLIVAVAPVPSIADTVPPVYHPQRLQTIKPSVTVVGMVTSRPTRQRDGDVTFELESGAQRYHIEIVCVYPPAFTAARSACAGYTNRIPIPRRGDRVRITGPLVRDLKHDSPYSEFEIHPVVTLVVLP